MAKIAQEDIEARVEEILALPYSWNFVPQEDGGFSAEILEFPGCFAEGETREEAYKMLEGVARSWITAQLEKDEKIPEPIDQYEGSGKFALRLSRMRYVQAAKAAKIEGVSLNQYIADAVAEKLGISRAAEAVQRALSEAAPHLINWSFEAKFGATEGIQSRPISVERDAANIPPPAPVTH